MLYNNLGTEIKTSQESHKAWRHQIQRGDKEMRYGDIQDTRKPEVIKEQKMEEFRRSYEWCMEKLASIHNGRKIVVVFGATFTI